MNRAEFLQALIIAMGPVVLENHQELTSREVAKKTREIVEAFYDEFGQDFSI